MAELTEFNYPSFFMFPYHTDRTAWRAFGLPMVLVVPHVRDAVGNTIPNAKVLSVTISILDTGSTPVAGHDHVGIFNPAYSLFSTTLDKTDLRDREIDLDNVTYLDASGNVTTENVSKIKFTCRAGIAGDVKYISHADYVDISDVKLAVEQLPPGRYVLSYEAKYYFRRISETGELLCIETDREVIAAHRFLISHPGEVLLMMFEGTPSIYFSEAKKSEDTTIAFYRPFSDALQDVHDEQNLLRQVNWVYNISAEHIPYLSFILGWELPYFPQSVDSLRRAVLRNIVKLQKLKGCKRAVSGGRQTASISCLRARICHQMRKCTKSHPRKLPPPSPFYWSLLKMDLGKLLYPSFITQLIGLLRLEPMWPIAGQRPIDIWLKSARNCRTISML